MLPCLWYVTYFLNVCLIVFFLSLLTYFFQLCLWQHKRWSYIIFAAQRSRGALVTGSQLSFILRPAVCLLKLHRLHYHNPFLLLVWRWWYDIFSCDNYDPLTSTVDALTIVAVYSWPYCKTDVSHSAAAKLSKLVVAEAMKQKSWPFKNSGAV